MKQQAQNDPKTAEIRASFWALLPLAMGLVLFVVNPFSPLEAPEINVDNVSALGTQNPGTLPVDYSGMPLQLRIQRIGVDAPFEPVGVLADGSMGVPKQPERVGWYAFGPRPGERGSAVVAGHRGWKNGMAVFDRLSELRAGDTILVADAENVWHTFIVRGSKVFDPTQDTEEVFRRAGVSGRSGKNGVFLNLITCEGEWDRSAGQFTKRLVVFAEGI
ncbi:MAG: class F sortase [bacterium]